MRFQGMGAAARVKACVPQRFAGVDIPDAGDARLIEQEVFQRPGRSSEQFAEVRGCEFARKSVSAECGESRTFFGRIPGMNAAKVTAVRESQDAPSRFECDIHVNAIFGLVGPSKELFCIGEPRQLAIEPEVQGEHAAVQDQKNVFASTINLQNSTACGEVGNKSSGLRFYSDEMQDVDITDPLSLNQGTQCADDRFDFREFRHGINRSGARLESERMLRRTGFCSFAERREDGLSFVPVGKLIGIVAAARLP